MIQAICWVLVHSLWQGVLLALVGGGVILCTKRSAAEVRYRLLCALLGVFLAGIGVTFVYEWSMASGSADGNSGVGVSMSWLADWCSTHAVQIVGAWLIITIVKSIRMVAGWKYMWRMRREGMMAPALWVERMDELSRRLDIRRTVKLVESALVRVPMVMGQLRPIIYIPLGLINHMPASEMEAVLLHELAHIRRYDYVVNMVQHVAECLLFFNPGFLWISSLLREERENSCDDMAIAHTRDRVEFVRALVRFSEHSLRRMVLAFPGDKRQLLHRVLRISRQENKTLNERERLVLFGGCLVLLCLLVARVGRADVKRVEEPMVKVTEVGGRPVEAQPVKTAPVELVSVLRAREQVAQNMEWVKAQLDQLHHKSGKKLKNKPVRIADEMPAKKEQAVKNRDQAQMQERAVRDGLQAEQERVQMELNRQQVLRNLEQDRLNRDQALRNNEQAVRDHAQAQKNREQAERDRSQAELARQRAEVERAKADQDRQLAELNQKRADPDGQQSKNN